MSTLYRPNHRFQGPQESGKHRGMGEVAGSGLGLTREVLQASQSYWDGLWAERLAGMEARTRSRAQIVDWHPPAGSYLSQLLISILAEDRRLVVSPAATLPEALGEMIGADALAIGVGGTPAGFDPAWVLPLIGRTPLILGRQLLPYLEDAWTTLGVFETADPGVPGPLHAFGLYPEIPSSAEAASASVIPDDGLGGRVAPIVSGRGAHRFFALQGPETLVLSFGLGVGPDGTTSAERSWTSLLIERWLAPRPEEVVPLWQIRNESEGA